MSTLAPVRSAPRRAATARGWLWPAAFAVAAALVRIPTLGRPLSSDEGGYLLVASQWAPGRSVYGAYFVDRPPVLIGLFAVAGRLGAAVPLRLIGLVGVVVSVLLAGRLAGSTGALICAALLSTPLFDAREIDGEILAVPFVLAACLFLTTSIRSNGASARCTTPFVAGVLAAAAALVKQNAVDGFVMAAVLAVGLMVRRDWRGALVRTGSFAVGAACALVVALAFADLRGTSPGALWDAVVTFRAQAAAVIDASAPSSIPARFHGMLLAGLVAGVPLVVGSALVALRRPSRDPLLAWVAVAVLAWEAAGAVLGGNYWLHYLIALVPGLVLLVGAGGAGWWPRLAATYTAVCAAVSVSFALQHPGAMSSDTEVAAYLRAASRPGDTVVVAFGHPDIVQASGLQSPYEHLWSLTARVRDPRLTQFGSVIRGPAAPRWVVVSGTSLATWGVDAAQAQAVLDSHYREAMVAGDWHVYTHH
jgi:hypothetical protein